MAYISNGIWLALSRSNARQMQESVSLRKWSRGPISSHLMSNEEGAWIITWVYPESAHIWNWVICVGVDCEGVCACFYVGDEYRQAGHVVFLCRARWMWMHVKRGWSRKSHYCTGLPRCGWTPCLGLVLESLIWWLGRIQHDCFIMLIEYRVYVSSFSRGGATLSITIRYSPRRWCIRSRSRW